MKTTALTTESDPCRGDDRSDIYRMVTARLRHYGVQLIDDNDEIPAQSG